MGEMMQEIFARRSIRKYLDKEVPDAVIKEIIRAGMAAPSSENEQPWQFIIINQRDLFYQIAEFDPYAKMLKRCGGAVVVCGDLSLINAEGFWIQGCSAATQNMLLQAVSLGVGAVWVGIYPTQELVDGVRKVLKLPEIIVPLSIVSLGYPAEMPEYADRYNESRIRYNSW